MPYTYRSFSEVDLFNQCERRYFKEKVQKHPTEENAYLLVGKTYHEALSAHIQDLPWLGLTLEMEEKLAKAGVNVDSMVTEMRANLARLGPSLELLGPPVTAPERYFRNRSIGYKGVVDSVFANTPTVSPEGIMTGVTPGRCVIDWKVLSSNRRRSARDAALSPQLALYSIEENVECAGFVEIPRDLEKPIKCRVVRYTEQDKAHWREFLRSTREAMFSRGRKEAAYKRCDRKANPLCSPLWCPFYGDCYPTIDDDKDEQPNTGQD